MKTPMRVFLDELVKTSIALTIGPGGPTDCHSDLMNGVIYLGNELPEDVQGIVGLHELGHFETGKFFPPEVRFILDRDVMYALELAAWDWAEKRMPPGYEGLFYEIKIVGLTSYQRRI